MAGLAVAIAALDDRAPFAELVGRLRGLAADITDVTSTVRTVGEGIEDDPVRLAEIQDRRRQLSELRRKYGDTLADVIAFHSETAARLASLTDRDRLAAELDGRRDQVVDQVRAAEQVVGRARRRAAPKLAEATQSHLIELAMPKAVVEVDVGPDPGDEVTYLLAANAGSPPLPLSRVASGGELARSMLALRLVLSEAPPTLVFDEVDAGIGGTAASAVGRALAALAVDHQVLVVTHLPQVAAWADVQVGIVKREVDDSTYTEAHVLDPDARQIEIARMLSGSPDSATARRHASELLAASRRAAP